MKKVLIKSFFLVYIFLSLFGCRNENKEALNNKPKHERLPDSLFTIHINYKNWNHLKKFDDAEFSISVGNGYNRKYFSQKYNIEDDCLDLQFRFGFTQENILLRIRPYESENSTVTKAFYIRWQAAQVEVYNGFNIDAYKQFIYMDTIHTNLDARTFKSIYPKFRGVVRPSVIDSLVINEDLFDSMANKTVGDEVELRLFAKFF
ncbi:MAG: hypothetical protein ACM34K_00625 [Bacillota bacterium]